MCFDFFPKSPIFANFTFPKLCLSVCYTKINIQKNDFFVGAYFFQGLEMYTYFSFHQQRFTRFSVLLRFQNHTNFVFDRQKLCQNGMFICYVTYLFVPTLFYFYFICTYEVILRFNCCNVKLYSMQVCWWFFLPVYNLYRLCWQLQKYYL